MYTKKRIINKRIIKRNQIMAGVTAILILFGLTGCTSKDEVLLELERQEAVQETENVLEKEAVQELQEQLGEQESYVLSEGEVDITLNDNKEAAGTQATKEILVPDTIYVHICGAVENPGVYELDAGSRVYQVIEAADGFTEDACMDYVNQAATLQDGQKIEIPTSEEVAQAKEDGLFQETWAAGEMQGQEAQDASLQTETETGSVDGRVNINTATESELCSVNGIGASRAAAIVKYRQENGSFASIEDIMKVSGIKEGTYEKIKDMITVK